MGYLELLFKLNLKWRIKNLKYRWIFIFMNNSTLIISKISRFVVGISYNHLFVKKVNNIFFENFDNCYFNYLWIIISKI